MIIIKKLENFENVFILSDKDHTVSLEIEKGEFGLYSVNFPYDEGDADSWFKDLKKRAKKEGILKGEPLYGFSELTSDDIYEDWIGDHKEDHPNSIYMKHLLETEPDLFEHDEDYTSEDDDCDEGGEKSR